MRRKKINEVAAKKKLEAAKPKKAPEKEFPNPNAPAIKNIPEKKRPKLTQEEVLEITQKQSIFMAVGYERKLAEKDVLLAAKEMELMEQDRLLYLYQVYKPQSNALSQKTAHLVSQEKKYVDWKKDFLDRHGLKGTHFEWDDETLEITGVG